MSSLFVDPPAAAGYVRSILSAGSRAGSASLESVDVGVGEANATLARLNADVAIFEGVMRLQLALGSVALASVIDDAVAADSPKLEAT